MTLSVFARSLFEAFWLAESDDTVNLLPVELFHTLHFFLGEREAGHGVDFEGLQVSDNPRALLLVVFEAFDDVPVLLQ